MPSIPVWFVALLLAAFAPLLVAGIAKGIEAFQRAYTRRFLR